MQERLLPNGLRVLFVPRQGLGVAALDVAVARGASVASPGLASFAAAMLLRGTTQHNADELSESFARLGVEATTSASHDAVSTSVRFLARDLAPVLGLVSEVVRKPAFARVELELERTRRLNQWTQLRDIPSALLSIHTSAQLFGPGHPYGFVPLGNDAAIRAIDRESLKRFHAEQFAPDSTTVCLAGDLEADEVFGEVERAFGDWTGKARAVAPLAPAAPKAEHIVLVDRPQATQSQVAIVTPGAARKSDDYAALLLANAVLGGQFSSRLNLELRERHAYTYGARSAFDMRKSPGPFTAGGAMVREKTGPAVTILLNELARMQREPVDSEELEAARANLMRQFPATFETVADITRALATLATYELPLDEFVRHEDRLRTVTAADVLRVANTFWKNPKIVVIGDAAVVRAQLEAIGAVSVTRW